MELVEHFTNLLKIPSYKHLKCGYSLFFAYLIYRILEIVTVINISEEKQKEETLSKMKMTFLVN